MSPTILFGATLILFSILFVLYCLLLWSWQREEIRQEKEQIRRELAIRFNLRN